MTAIRVVYEGQLRARAVHGPSGSVIETDAPTDNHGQGERFSPTDLVAAALGSCVLTVMGIVARRHGMDLDGARADVTKEMTTEAPRRIRSLDVVVTFARPLEEAQRLLLERTALACPVHHALHPDLHVSVRFMSASEPA